MPDGASGSSTTKAKLLVPAGGSDHSSGGDRFSPSAVYFAGIGSPLPNAGLFKLKAISVSSHSSQVMRSEGTPDGGMSCVHRRMDHCLPLSGRGERNPAWRCHRQPSAAVI